MKIGIIGAGGVGGYFGGKLAKAGNEVTFVARGQHLEAIKASGLQVKSINGNFHINSVQVTSQISDLRGSDLIILGVKAWQVKEMALTLKGIVSNNTIVLPLQNGVLASTELLEHLDKENVIGGLCLIFSKIESPGIIHHMGFEPTITFGELNKQYTDRAKELKRLFDVAEISNNLSDDIEAELWKKFILICLSGLGAITDLGYGLLREQPESRQIIRDVLSEVYEIAKAKHIALPTDIVDKSLAIVDTYPYDSKSSLARDVLEGKPSEIEYQNGTIVKFGSELGIETPANKFIYGMVKLLELKNRKT